MEKQVKNSEFSGEGCAAHIRDNTVQTVKEHLRNVAEISSENAADMGLKNTLYACGLVHDIGKYSDEFNDYIHKAVNNEETSQVIHTFAGVRYLLRYDSHFGGENKSGDVAAEIMACAVGSHHSLFNLLNDKRESGFVYRMEKQPEYDKMAIAEFVKENGEIDFDKCKEEIRGKTVECFKLCKGSGKAFLFYLALLERYICSVLIDADRQDTHDFMEDTRHKKETPDFRSAYDNLLEYVSAFGESTPINKARKEMSEICASFADTPPGVYRLNIPTGGGKTLSSMRYALRHAVKFNKKRIIYVIPLLSILEQNADSLRKATKAEILEHHSNIVNDNGSRELMETWDAPIIITTLVQMLNTMFSAKTSSVRRFHSLENSVIIFDEIQSLPTNVTSLFNLTVNFLSRICNATVVLCSATQPELSESKWPLFIDGDIVPEMDGKVFKRCHIEYIGKYNYDSLAEHINRNNGQSVLVVCNKKGEVDELYDRIEGKKYYLTTSLCPKHRRDIIKRISESLKNREDFTLVSTQLIEAGVDLSFDYTIRVLAGLDNAIQTAGRENRNGEHEIGNMSIVSLEEDDVSMLPDIQRSKDVMIEFLQEFNSDRGKYDNDLASAKSIRAYYRILNKKISEAGNISEYPTELRTKTLLDLMSDNIPDDRQKLTFALKTAGELFRVFDDEQVTVIVPYGAGEKIINNIMSEKAKYDERYLMKNIKSAKEYTVSIPQSQFEKLKDIGAVISDGNVNILTQGYYDETRGVVKGEQNWNLII